MFSVSLIHMQFRDKFKVGVKIYLIRSSQIQINIIISVILRTYRTCDMEGWIWNLSIRFITIIDCHLWHGPLRIYFIFSYSYDYEDEMHSITEEVWQCAINAINCYFPSIGVHQGYFPSEDPCLYTGLHLYSISTADASSCHFTCDRTIWQISPGGVRHKMWIVKCHRYKYMYPGTCRS